VIVRVTVVMALPTPIGEIESFAAQASDVVKRRRVR